MAVVVKGTCSRLCEEERRSVDDWVWMPFIPCYAVKESAAFALNCDIRGINFWRFLNWCRTLHSLCQLNVLSSYMYHSACVKLDSLTYMSQRSSVIRMAVPWYCTLHSTRCWSVVVRRERSVSLTCGRDSCGRRSRHMRRTSPSRAWLWTVALVRRSALSLAAQTETSRSVSFSPPTLFLCWLVHVSLLLSLVRINRHFWMNYNENKCKKLQFIHTVNGDGSKTAKIIKRQC